MHTREKNNSNSTDMVAGSGLTTTRYLGLYNFSDNITHLPEHTKGDWMQAIEKENLTEYSEGHNTADSIHHDPTAQTHSIPPFLQSQKGYGRLEKN